MQRDDNTAGRQAQQSDQETRSTGAVQVLITQGTQAAQHSDKKTHQKQRSNRNTGKKRRCRSLLMKQVQQRQRNILIRKQEKKGGAT